MQLYRNALSGKFIRGQEPQSNQLSRVVKQLISNCKSGNHHLFFDNFFTFADLIKELGDIGFAATGTIRQNRLKGCPTVPVDTMKKKDRGAFERLLAGNTEMVRWNDNNVVPFCSNAAGVEPVSRNCKMLDKGQTC